jgi:hypothetical protein
MKTKLLGSFDIEPLKKALSLGNNYYPILTQVITFQK